MSYTEEEWEYFQNWTNYSSHKDIEYSKQQMEYFMRRLATNEYFSLVRFGEGESRIFVGEQILQRSELSYDPKSEKQNFYVQDLISSATVNHPNYFVGIQSYTYKPKEPNRPENEFIIQRQMVYELGKLPKHRYTCSRIFCNFHREWQNFLFNLTKDKPVYLICSENANTSTIPIQFKNIWKVPKKDAWKTTPYANIIEELSSQTNYILLTACGFYGNVLISKLKNFDSAFNINVGSIFDTYFFGKATRPYLR